MQVGPSPDTPEPTKNSSKVQPMAVASSRGGAEPLRDADLAQNAVEASSASVSGSPYLPLQISLLRQVALVHARRGEFSQAVAILNRLIARQPNDANHYNNRGVLHWRAGQIVAAIADFNAALRLNPNLHNAYNNRANLHAAQGNWQASIQDYQQALNLNPFNVRARINLGITYRDMQDYPTAIACFDEALTFGNLTGQIYAERGRTYHLWGDWNYAIADYRKAIALLQRAIVRQVDAPKALAQRVQSWLGQLALGKTA